MNRSHHFAAGALTLALAVAASAETLRWINPSGGAWDDLANWSPMQTPTLADSLLFTLDAQYAVAGSGEARTMHVSNGEVALNGAIALALADNSGAGSLDIAPAMNDVARLRIEGDVTAGFANVGGEGVATLEVTGRLVLNWIDGVPYSGSLLLGGSSSLSVRESGRIEGTSLIARDVDVRFASGATFDGPSFSARAYGAPESVFEIVDAEIRQSSMYNGGYIEIAGYDNITLSGASLQCDRLEMTAARTLTITNHSTLRLDDIEQRLIAETLNLTDVEIDSIGHPMYQTGLLGGETTIAGTRIHQPDGGVLGLTGLRSLSLETSSIVLGDAPAGRPGFPLPLVILRSQQMSIGDDVRIDAFGIVHTVQPGGKYAIDGANVQIRAHRFPYRSSFFGPPTEAPGVILVGAWTELAIRQNATLETGILSIGYEQQASSPETRTTLRLESEDALVAASEFVVVKTDTTLEFRRNAAIRAPLVVLQQRFLNGVTRHGVCTGDGRIIGDLVNGGILSPGSGVGRLRVNGAYNMTRTDAPDFHYPPVRDFVTTRTVFPGRLHIDIATTGRPRADLLEITGAAALDGDLAFFTDGPGLVRPGDYVFLTAASVTGEFARVSLPPLHAGFTAEVVYEPKRIYLRVRARADLTGDQRVNGRDLAALLSAWNSSDPAADLNADGVVSGPDLAALLAAWSN